MKGFRQFLDEGVNDPGIFKAIYLAGGPGAGKSFVADKTLPNAAFGLKVVNADIALEFLLKKSGLSSDMLSMSPAELEKFAAKRAKARQLRDIQKKGFINGRLGMILDGTGRDFNKIKKDRAELESFGYDTFMVFVNTSLPVALERNQNRPRKVDEKIVRDAWSAVQGNIGKFQALFGANNFVVVDNNNLTEDIIVKTFKVVKKFVSKPPQSRLAKEWIANERRIK